MVSGECTGLRNSSLMAEIPALGRCGECRRLDLEQVVAGARFDPYVEVRLG